MNWPVTKHEGDLKVKRKLTLPIIILAALQFSCSAFHRHSIENLQPADKIPEGVQVKIGSSEVKEGDRISIFRKVCKPRRAGHRPRGKMQTCSNKKVGEASVIKVLDHDSAIVQPDSGITIESTMLFEKI